MKCNGNTVKKFLINVIHLMSEYDGKSNIPELIDEQSGEILVWERKSEYCTNYAVIPLLSDGKLTPTNQAVRDNLYKNAQLGRVVVIEYKNQAFTLTPYASEISCTVVTVGYIIRKATIKKLG